MTNKLPRRVCSFRVPALVSVVLLSACASHPDDIDSAYVSPLKYKDYDCDQIALEMDHVGQRTNELYQRLDAEEEADAWQMGIGLVLFWPALFWLEGGDGPEAAEYAQLKGEFEALRETSVAKKCSLEEKQSPREIIESEQKQAADDAKEASSEAGAQFEDMVGDFAREQNCGNGVSFNGNEDGYDSYTLLCPGGDVMDIRCGEQGCFKSID